MSTKPAAHEARDLGVSKSVLYRWRDEFGDRSEANLTVEQEVQRLGPQVRVLEMAPKGGEILQKASPFFATLLRSLPGFASQGSEPQSR